VALLQRMEQTDFFGKVPRRPDRLALQPEKSCGRNSAMRAPPRSMGGYIKRGFADIDWLPKA